MIAEQIIKNWDISAIGYGTKINDLFECGYPAWTIKLQNEYGVAIPIDKTIEVFEKFSGAKLYTDTMIIDENFPVHVLLLTTELSSIKIPFATLCAELILPGEKGQERKEIVENPVLWWEQWKELLGNKNIDDRVYDVLGELMTVLYLSKEGEQPIWNGPCASTYDIDCDETYFEVKSSITRNRRQITLSNHFQLDPPDGKILKLIFCQFEPAQTGYTINSVVEELVQQGYSRDDLNQKLELLGLEKKKSARNRCYDLHSMLMYKIDDKFPAIKESSFVNGVLPVGVESITYTVSLDGVEVEKKIVG